MGSSKVSKLNFSTKISNDKIIRMILAGLTGVIIVEIYAGIMQREFQNTDNKLGKGFAILGIYLFVVIYCKLSLHLKLLPANSALLHRRHAQQYNLALRR